MELTTEEARVLASLIEAEAIAPERYPVTLNSLRLACNQTAGRNPVVAYDDRTVESALLSLTSKGLVRSVQAPDGEPGARYRHTAGDRWRLDADELAVLGALVLGGSQIADDVRRRLDRLFLGKRPIRIDEVLDTLAARSPEPLAARQSGLPGDSGPRWVHRLSGPPSADEAGDRAEAIAAAPDTAAERSVVATLQDEVSRLSAVVNDLDNRVAQIEKLIGLTYDDAD